VKNHFDGWGHRTCDYFELVKRYQADARSIRTLRNFAPHRYVVCPDVEIHVKKNPLDQSSVVLVYPGERRVLRLKMTKRQIEALRRLYLSSEVTWRHKENPEEVIFYRCGSVVENKAATDYSASSGGGR